MKTKYIAIIAGAALTTFIIGCGGGSEEQADTGTSSEVMGMTDSSAAELNLTVYPLEVCLISGEKLGSMGEPILASFQGQEFKFCCKDCLGDFNSDKEAALAKLISKASEAGIPMESMEHSDTE